MISLKLRKLSICLLVYRNDIQDSTQSCELELPLITAKSIPPLPRLYNPDPRLGRIVKYRVLGYAFSRAAVARWADDHQIDPDETEVNRRRLTWQAMCQKLPPDCRRISLVHTDSGALARCIVVATNGTSEDLKRAEDVEMINTVQKVLDASGTPPKWYHPEHS
jgi:hypothetical protein